MQVKLVDEQAWGSVARILAILLKMLDSLWAKGDTNLSNDPGQVCETETQVSQGYHSPCCSF